MASPRPTLKGMMTSCGPMQESIMQNLTRWEFRNLQLAGIRISVSREYQRRHQLPDHCNEICHGTQCDNSTESFDVRSCKGRPMIVMKNGKLLLKECVGTTPMEPCIRDDWWRWWRLDQDDPNPNPEPNRDQYPIHTKVCRPCRDASAAELLEEQLLNIAQYNAPLCKTHSLDQAIAQLPLNVCRCLAFVRDPWRCRRCYISTLSYLAYRAHNQPPLRQIVSVWQRAWMYLKSLWASQQQPGPVCPLEGCSRQAWLEQNSERMHMCLACYAITKT
ncbi:hypothetical protein MMC07_006369 [Pseudocyphellaria aurata]|nr:hypothetical protein [Pseudocyphellaria aurata]